MGSERGEANEFLSAGVSCDARSVSSWLPFERSLSASTHFPHEVPYSYQVVRCVGEGKDPSTSVKALVPCLPQEADRLEPPKTFFDDFAFALTDLVSRMPGSAKVNATFSVGVILCQVRLRRTVKTLRLMYCGESPLSMLRN